MTKNLQEKIIELLMAEGVSDVGFAFIADSIAENLNYTVSIAVRLSDDIVNEISDKPTHTYFHHYRTVNSFIDSTLLKLGLFLQSEGYKYIPIAASQTINDKGWNYQGRYSHKKAACLAGMGSIGVNSLFLHRDFGCRVRLGTLFTDLPLERRHSECKNRCSECMACVKACPAGAIKGLAWGENISREEMFDAKKCSEYMKQNGKDIGRGAVCGICMKVCGV